MLNLAYTTQLLCVHDCIHELANIAFIYYKLWASPGNTNSINDCNTSLGKDAMNRVSTNGLFVAFFFPIGVNFALHTHRIFFYSTIVS